MVVKNTVIFIIIFVATVQEINYKAGGGGGLKIDTDVCVVPFLESPARIAAPTINFSRPPHYSINREKKWDATSCSIESY